MHGTPYRIRGSRSTAATNPRGSRHPAATSRDLEHRLEHRRRFALAIVKPGGKALLIDASNEGTGWVAIDVAVTKQAAFAVELDEEILAGDSDRPDNASNVDQLVEELRNAGHQPVLVASGQPERFHVLARIADADDRKRFAKRARDLCLDVRHCIRPPLAPHRLGLQPHLLDPADPEAALEALRPTPISDRLSPHTQRPRKQGNGTACDTPRSEVAERRHHGNSISPHMQRLLEQGDGTGRYRSRSEIVQALALAAVNADWSFELFLRSLLNPQHAGGEKVQKLVAKRGIRHARLYAHRSWRRAERRAAAIPSFRDREGARAVVDTIERHADQREWPGKAGGTDRAVLQAHLELARKVGSLTYGASDRLVAERAGVTFPTANKSHRRLAAHAWLERLELGRGRRASIWRLRLPEGRNRNTPITAGGYAGEC
jgi:hypothetical protein